MQNYGQLRIEQLKGLLRQRGAKVTGKKRDLVDRLEAYDRNDDFGRAEISDDVEEQFSIPSEVVLTSLSGRHRTVMPNVDYQSIQDYMGQRGGQIHKSAYPMFKAKFVKYVTVGELSGTHYFQGVIRAEMKKHMAYMVLLSLDRHGVVANAHCECAAGSGMAATCKHVNVLLFAVEHFVGTGDLLVEVTCTEKGSTWNKPVKRKLVMSPLKCREMSYKVDRYMGQDHGPSRSMVKPESVETSAAETARFRSLLVNYECTRGVKLGGSAAFMGLGSLSDAAKDHDYLEEDIGERAIRHMHAVTPQRAEQIAVETVQGSKEWHKERNVRLTASNFGRVMNMKPSTDPEKLAAALANPKPLDHVPAIAYGKEKEGFVRKKLEKMYDFTIQQTGLVIDKKNTMLGCSPDGIVDGTLVEIKCPYSAKDLTRDEAQASLPYLVDHPTKGKAVKERSLYWWQVQGQLGITGLDYCYFVVYVNDRGDRDQLIMDIIKRVPGLYENEMVPKLRAFYENHLSRALQR